MAAYVDTLIATITVGSLYALVALGYTLVYGVLKFINFAHSDIFVLGAWTSFTGATVLINRLNPPPEHAPWWVAVLVLMLAVAVCATTGYLIERFAYRPLRRAPRLNVLITAIGVSLLLQNIGQLPGAAVASDPAGQKLATLPFGPTPRNMPTLLPDAVVNNTIVASGNLRGGEKRGVVRLDRDVELLPDRQYSLSLIRRAGDAARVDQLRLAVDAGRYPAGTELATQPRRSPSDLDGATYDLVLSPRVPIRLTDLLIVGSSLTLMILLQVLIFRTRMGSAMRAVSFNFETASLMGINTNKVISFTFVLGTALAAAAAFLYAQKYPGLNQTASGIWVLLGLKAFVAAVVGGIGNVRGAVLGGFLIAAIEFFGAKFYAPLRDVYVFSLLILVLLFKPNGLLGTTVREKV